MEGVQEVLLAVVSRMVVVVGVRKMGVRGEPKAGLSSARVMGVANGASILVVQEVLKAVLTCVFPMVVAGDAITRDASRLQEESLACASDMGVARGAVWKVARGVQRVSPACASLMEVAVVASNLAATRVLKGAQCFVKGTVGGKGARP